MIAAMLQLSHHPLIQDLMEIIFFYVRFSSAMHSCRGVVHLELMELSFFPRTGQA